MSRGKLQVFPGLPPVKGKTLLEREIPSDAALVKPLVIRTVEFLQEEEIIRREDQCKVGLCLEEALMNGVKHGNKYDFKKKVKLRVYLDQGEWGIVVSDEGAGFDPSSVRDPCGSDAIWGESGRGLYLISHYMDRAEYYNNGNTLLMAVKL
jgi:serine/threonine-protein kinase RsbW